MVIVSTEILWGCCTFHSLQGEHWPYTIFYFYSITALDCFPRLFIMAEERIEANLQLFPPCNFEKLPDKKTETHTVVVALHSILCLRGLCWLFPACFDVFSYPPSLCSSGSAECKTCSGGFGLQCVNSSFSPSLYFFPIKPGLIWCLFAKMGRKIIPVIERSWNAQMVNDAALPAWWETSTWSQWALTWKPWRDTRKEKPVMDVAYSARKPILNPENS